MNRFFCFILLGALGGVSVDTFALNYFDQGPEWTQSQRKFFYRADQGSRLIPYKWLAALKQPSGDFYLRNQLSRYGYIPNGKGPSNPYKLPIGFLVANENGVDMASMTCAACHTRQIQVKGKSYVIDGGPANTDFESFMKDLDIAVGVTLSNEGFFKEFARRVLHSNNPDPASKLQLKKDLSDWYLPYHTIVKNSLTREGMWGLGRLDAFSMIINRFAGLDIGPPPTYMIPENMQPAIAPVRYPFIWNASRQDYTQWPGMSVNGNAPAALGRNFGEVLGVFGIFHPQRNGDNSIDYLSVNSTNFEGLMALEDSVRKIGPPKWPWKTNPTLVAQGAKIYSDQCGGCHGISPGEPRPPEQTWATPVMFVNTDTLQGSVFSRMVNSGVMQGVVAKDGSIIAPIDLALKVLSTAEYNALEQKYPDVIFPIGTRTGAVGVYESRVLEGIWAAPPYLHNGSVASMAELLKPATERKSSFAVGTAYDPVNLGLADKQPHGKKNIRTLTGCSDLNSGNSKCGHEFGTTLPPQDKEKLLEYLKTL